MQPLSSRLLARIRSAGKDDQLALQYIHTALDEATADAVLDGCYELQLDHGTYTYGKTQEGRPFSFVGTLPPIDTIFEINGVRYFIRSHANG